MCFGGSRRGAGTRRALDRPKYQAGGLGHAFETRKHKTSSTHVSWLFLHPNDLPGAGMFGDGGGNLGSRQRIKLVKKKDRGARVFAAASFGAQFVTDFAAGDQD